MAYTDRFEEAVQYAVRLHREQHRKGTSIPYITHLLAVASLLGEHSDDEDAVIAALLHDAVEDQGGAVTRREIADRFGERVATIVDACTDADTIPKPPWRPRKEAYIAHLNDPHTPEAALLVSAADKLHNSRCILADVRKYGILAFAKFSVTMTEVLWYYKSVLEAIERRLPGHPLVEELGRVVGELHVQAYAAGSPANASTVSLEVSHATPFPAMSEGETRL